MPILNKHHITPKVRKIKTNIIPDEVIAYEIENSKTYNAYKNANIYKVVEIKDAYDGMLVYDWTEAVGFMDLTEAVVYMHDKTKRFPKKKYDILPM